jgi:hypothetical protein
MITARRGRKPAVHNGFTKGMIVRKYQKWGNDAGKPDMSAIYVIRKIGPIMAMLDRLDPNTMQKYPWRRGRNEMINTKEAYDIYVARQREGHPVPVWDYPYDWAHVFIQVGQEGWDPDF